MAWLEEFVLRNINPVTLQEPNLAPEAALELLKAEVDMGLTALVANNHKHILFVVRRRNEYICEVHLISENGRGFELVEEGKKGLDWLWTNTKFKRAELRTANKGVVAMAKRCGWEYVGTHKDCFLTKDGQWIDEYIYGINRPE